ncbi:fluoride efflux transporter CrcB [Anaerostipes sp.]|uniref:fluoride efflux transporter CrcB n=1 Tax=Anaerostipes sp. TaxID=1872530 RepID=UPI0025B887C3|nr:fluoride efflux transporter CrcB [Anaerostipes sp.]MBS7007607.1 fluoride efflux transporter CrcB [Anaerostipes sp.]
MAQCIFVGLGGFFGAVFRYLLGLIPISAQFRFPAVTLGINVLGGFAIGMIAGWTGRVPAGNPNLILFLKTGLCGGFTTFSTFALETGTLVSEGKWREGICYAVMSVIFSVLAVFAGQAVTG